MPTMIPVMLVFIVFNRFRLLFWRFKRVLHIESFLHTEDTVLEPNYISQSLTNTVVKHIVVGTAEYGNQFVQRLPSMVVEYRKRQHDGNLPIIVTPLQCPLDFLTLASYTRF